MTTATKENAAKYRETIRIAAERIRTPDATPGNPLLNTYAALGACATSTTADIAAITWHLVYHTGHAPKMVAPSRGHSYRVTTRLDEEFIARVDDFRDHRAGVSGFGFGVVGVIGHGTMKPETIARRRAEQVVRDAARIVETRARLEDAAAREAKRVAPELWVFAGPEGMLAEFVARHGA
jgi:hypothetical protein